MRYEFGIAEGIENVTICKIQISIKVSDGEWVFVARDILTNTECCGGLKGTDRKTRINREMIAHTPTRFTCRMPPNRPTYQVGIDAWDD